MIRLRRSDQAVHVCCEAARSKRIEDNCGGIESLQPRRHPRQRGDYGQANERRGNRPVGSGRPDCYAVAKDDRCQIKKSIF